MEHKFPYTFHSTEDSIPWTFVITFDEDQVIIQGIEPERHREIYRATLLCRNDKINWDRLPTTSGLRNDKLYPSELRIYVEKLLAMKAFW